MLPMIPVKYFPSASVTFVDKVRPGILLTRNPLLQTPSKYRMPVNELREWLIEVRYASVELEIN